MTYRTINIIMRYNAHVGVRDAKELYEYISRDKDPEELTEQEIDSRIHHLRKCDRCGEWNSDIFMYQTTCMNCKQKKGD